MQVTSSPTVRAKLFLGPESLCGASYVPDFLNELVLWQRRLEELDLVALRCENVLRRLVDVLQEENLDVFGSERLQVLRGGGGFRGGAGVKGAGGRVEGGGGRCRDAQGVCDGVGRASDNILRVRHVWRESIREAERVRLWMLDLRAALW